MIRVLLIEDDRDLAETLLQLMELAQMLPDHVSNGIAGLTLARSNSYDVLVIDVGLPKLDGYSVCKQLRASGIDTPILFLTAFSSIDNKLEGFASGGDDYLAKPFDNRELIARITALSGRKSSHVKRLEIAGLIMNCEQQQVSYQGQKLELTPACYTLLEVLMRASPEIVSRQSLENKLWGDEPPSSNVLKAHIYYLRRALTQVQLAEMLYTSTGRGWALRPSNTR
ncbi:two component transcriptional regulator, winged helix family [Shewanella halifaxensis HAW-EB4]|uniref:Two component transcriptional regulator, winged helix family n=1 Tax=Shewanella halifaxensis (strain HAW-EB4) TaxID=458817 RepID=B0TMV1_SHEHH|nr:response regulator transcription factor [Shewanella halifaxensis]ABZ77461.1 two component transcriptional regulator, winged helix family [Shewanella halifaxensis HAW-EB4]